MSTSHVLVIGADSFIKRGVETYLLNLYKLLDHDKIKMDFLTPYDCKNEEFFELTSQYGDKVIELKISGNKISKLILFYRKICQHVKKKHYDTVYINTGSMLPMTAAVMAAYTCRIQNRVVHSHNNGVSSLKNKIEQFITRPILAICPTKYAACSQNAADYVFPRKYAPKALIVPNGIEIDRFVYNENKRRNIRNQYSLEDKFVIGHVGAFNIQKNQTFLIDYFAEAYQVDNSLRMVLVGEGQLMETVKKKVENLNLQNEVIFVGKTDCVQEWLCVFDLFVFPSTFEGFGIAAVEAQISGLPCLLSDKVPKEVQVTDTVWYLPINNGREDWVLQTMKLRGQCRKGSFITDRIRRYDMKSTAKLVQDELLEIYED